MYSPPHAPAAWRSASRGQHATLAVFLAALSWFAAFAWVRPLALPDEGRYVGVAWEMFRSGNWITPTLDGLSFFHKPPLFYWITAAAMHLFGHGAWAARTTSILAGAATVAVTYATLRRWLGERPARTAALVLATQPLFFGASQFANMDMLVAACISAAILFGARSALAFEARLDWRRDLACAYQAAALGVLAKGLIGLVIPGLVLTLWLASLHRWRAMRLLAWPPGLAMVSVIALPWFVAVQWAHPGFLHYFVVVQHLQRYAGGGFNNVQPFWFYLPVLLLLTLPWSAWCLVGLRGSIASRSALSSSATSSSSPSPGPEVMSLMCVWLGVVLAFFSIPQSKLVGYVLPALVPLAVVAALAGERAIVRSAMAAKAWRASVVLAASTCVAVTVGFAATHPKSSEPFARAMLARHAHGGVAFIDQYRYDLPFYLRDTSPVRVVANWDPAEVQRSDNWRKELADAGGFAPEAAASRLLDAAGFRAGLCGGQVQWVVARIDDTRRYPFLRRLPQVAADHGSALWHIDASDLALRSVMGCNVASKDEAGASKPAGDAPPAR